MNIKTLLTQGMFMHLSSISVQTKVLKAEIDEQILKDAGAGISPADSAEEPSWEHEPPQVILGEQAIDESHNSSRIKPAQY